MLGSPRYRRWIGAVLVLAGLAFAGFVVAQFAGAQRDEPILRIGHPIRAGNRDTLSLCVDGARGYRVTEADLRRIGDALETAVVGFDEEIPAEYADRSVVIGCPPPPPTLLEDPIDYIELQDSAPAVDVPSPHRAFLYVLPDEVYSRSLDPLPYFTGNAEVVCGGDVCSTVTTAVYVPASISAEELNESLLGAVGLRIPQRFLDD